MSEPPADPGATELDSGLRRWIEETTGRKLLAARLVSGGNRHGTFTLEVESDDSEQEPFELILRVSDVGGDDGPPPLRREAAAYLALEPTDVSVPKVLASHPARQAILLSKMPGRPDFHTVEEDDRRSAIREDLMRELAALHRQDPADLELGILGSVAELDAHVRQEIQLWEDRYRHVDRPPDPVIELGLAWCSENVPSDTARPSLVHGDVGPGNFLFEEDRITALLDWEFCHLGDPLEDLATLSLRMVHGGMEGFPDLLESYGYHARINVSPDRLAYHQVLAALRWVILRHTARGEELDVRTANRMMSNVLHRRLLIEALAAALHEELPPPPAVPTRNTPRTELYDLVAELLRHPILPNVQSSDAATAVKSTARVVKYLAEMDRIGDAASEEIVATLREVVPDGGETEDDLYAALADRIAAGEISVRDALHPVAVIVAWENELMRPALGALADRPLPRVDAQL